MKPKFWDHFKEKQISYETKYDIVAKYGLGSIRIMLTSDHVRSRTWDIEWESWDFIQFFKFL